MVQLFRDFKIISIDSYLRRTPITFENCDKKIEFILWSELLQNESFRISLKFYTNLFIVV